MTEIDEFLLYYSAPADRSSGCSNNKNTAQSLSRTGLRTLHKVESRIVLRGTQRGNQPVPMRTRLTVQDALEVAQQSVPLCLRCLNPKEGQLCLPKDALLVAGSIVVCLVSITCLVRMPIDLSLEYNVSTALGTVLVICNVLSSTAGGPGC